MSDNEDILGDELDHTLADYNLGNDEEDQLLADDYDNGASQNVPSSMGNFVDQNELNTSYSGHNHVYIPNVAPYMPSESECVVPNITVEVRTPTYAPYEPPQHVPQPMPAAPMEPPQIVPSEHLTHNTVEPGRDHFPSERPQGLRIPQQRIIPDTLDAVVVPRGAYQPRARMSWRPPLNRFNHPYKKTNVFRGRVVGSSPSFPPVLPPPPRFTFVPPGPAPYRPRPYFTPPGQGGPGGPGGQGTQGVQTRDPGPHGEEGRPAHTLHLPAKVPKLSFPNNPASEPLPERPPIMVNKEPEVRMLPMPLPPNRPNVPGKKVLINPHFKGNFHGLQEPGVATYVPTRITKSPPLLPIMDNKFGNVKDLDDAAERFIAEQRSALARAATRNIQRRSPPRYIENTRIEIVNDMTSLGRDEELLRRQEEFIQANRQGLRRRMRSPSPPPPPRAPRRSPSPPARIREDRRRQPRLDDEDYEYRRKLAEQESLRERVLRAKEVRRRKNAIQHHNEKERPRSPVKPETNDRDVKKAEEGTQKEVEGTKKDLKGTKTESEGRIGTKEVTSTVEDDKMDKEKSRVEVVTPERSPISKPALSTEADGNLTPPLPPTQRRNSSPKVRKSSSDDLLSSEDDLDLILGDIEGILSDDEKDSRFKSSSSSRNAPPRQKSKTPPRSDLRSKLPPRNKQKIIFNKQDNEDDNRRAKTPPLRRNVVTSSTENRREHDKDTIKSDSENVSRPRQRIVFDKKEKQPSPPKEKEQKPTEDKQKFPNRRVILQRKVANPSPQKSVFSRIEIKTTSDPTKPNPGIFSRAVRTALSGDNNRIVIKKSDEPEIEYGSDDDVEKILIESSEVSVKNLPPGFTDARVRSLAGSQVQKLAGSIVKQINVICMKRQDKKDMAAIEKKTT